MFFKKYKKIFNHKPVSRGFYAFNSQRAGDFLIFVSETTDYHKFIYLPGGKQFYLTHEDFSSSIKNETISFVEQLPAEIFDGALNLTLPSNQRTEYNHLDEKHQKQ